MKIKPKFIDPEMTDDSELSAGLALKLDKSVMDNIFTDTSEPTGFLNQVESVLSFDDSTRTLTLAPASTSFSIYIKGTKYTFNTTLTKQIPDTSGSYFFYLNALGELQYLTAFDTSLFSSVAYCAYVLWDADDNKAITFAEERHSIILDSATHSNLHLTRGTQLVSGAAIGFTTTGDGTSAADAQVSISDAVVLDEDIRAVISHNSSPSARFQQILSPIAEIPIYYRLNSNWKKTTATQYPIKFGTTRAQYNKNTAGTWSLEDASADNKFLVSYIFVTTNIKEPVIAIMGQDEYTDLSDAKARASWSNVSFGDLPAQEIKLAHIIFFETSSTYTNAVKSAVRDVNDVRFGTDREISAVSLNTAHANLSGLLNDDHTQYFNQTRGDARYYTQSFLDTALAGKQPTGNYITALTGDVTATGPGSVTATLSDTGVTPGSYTSVTVDAKGRVTDGIAGTSSRFTYKTILAVATTSATYASVADLTSINLGIGTYKFYCHGLMRSSAANTGVGIRISTGTATVSRMYGKWKIKQAADGTAANYQYDQLTSATNITSASVQTANTDFAVEGNGVFVVTVAGTVAIQTRTETNGQTATLQPNSIFIIEGV
jgi:hypothetical protein